MQCAIPVAIYKFLAICREADRNKEDGDGGKDDNEKRKTYS